MTFLGKLLQEQVFNRINNIIRFQLLSGYDAIRYLESICTGTDNEFISDFTMIAWDGTIMEHCIVNNFTFNAHFNNGLFSNGEGTLSVQEIKLFEVIASGKI